jgi:hypothetical protein
MFGIYGLYHRRGQRGQLEGGDSPDESTNLFVVDTPGVSKTYTWVCPPNVFNVSAVCIGGGGAGARDSSGAPPGGGGGGLGWKNNIPVIPGKSYTVRVGAGGRPGVNGSLGNPGNDSYFISPNIVKGQGGGSGGSAGGGYVGDGGGSGGRAPGSNGGGGGAGGYTGNGGNGGYNSGSDIPATAGQGGAGGGGYGQTYTFNSGHAGGGVGLYGQGAG